MKQRQFKWKWITCLCLLGALSVQMLAKDDDNADNEVRENSQAEVLNGVDVTTTEIENAGRVLSELEAEAMADFVNHQLGLTIDQMGFIIDPERIAPAIHYLFDSVAPLFDRVVLNLGVEFEYVDLQLKVKTLHDDSPFKDSDLREGDVIVSINGTLVPTQQDDFARFSFPELVFEQISMGTEPLVLEVSRSDETLELEVPTNQETWQDYYISSYLTRTPSDHNLTLNRFFAREVEQSRLVLMEIESDLGQYFDVEFGVLVLQAPERSLLKPGDILLEVGDQKIRAISHVRKSLRNQNEKVEARVKRRSKNVQIQADLTGMIIREIEEE
ncbi:MAG: hypothetical protein F4039_02405 [Gammaproteobacteria bacterium]|nr:hypothetical protein [Gammaproteobacteria bacterium]MYF53834.1 hypothetical protein [Gammaproteobacteria bacterium]MYK42926.1 hypothetical protein [Gammaproteobacteria bacterium]